MPQGYSYKRKCDVLLCVSAITGRWSLTDTIRILLYLLAIMPFLFSEHVGFLLYFRTTEI